MTQNLKMKGMIKFNEALDRLKKEWPEAPIDGLRLAARQKKFPTVKLGSGLRSHRYVRYEELVKYIQSFVTLAVFFCAVSVFAQWPPTEKKKFYTPTQAKIYATTNSVPKQVVTTNAVLEVTSTNKYIPRGLQKAHPTTFNWRPTLLTPRCPSESGKPSECGTPQYSGDHQRPGAVKVKPGEAGPTCKNPFPTVENEAPANWRGVNADGTRVGFRDGKWFEEKPAKKEVPHDK